MAGIIEVAHAVGGVGEFVPENVWVVCAQVDFGRGTIAEAVRGDRLPGDGYAQAGSDVKGRPQRTGADVHAITFTDNTGYAANSYAVPGAGSWGICEVCHTRTAAYAATGAGTDNAGTHGSRTGNCSTCHSHAQGFKGACNICHSYPGQDNTGTNLKQMSVGHRDHVGVPGAGGTTNSRDFACEVCHFNYVPTHNQNGYAPGQAWGGTYYTNVGVRFDNTWNPGSPTYAGANASTQNAPGNGGTGICAGLYCHGGNATRNAGWGGSDNTPVWNDPATGSCGTCHDTGTGDTSPSTSYHKYQLPCDLPRFH